MRTLIKLIIYIGDRKEERFLRLLAKLEFGVAIFCEKLSRMAHEEGYYNLSKMLAEHAKQEEKHGRMLSSLVDGCDRISLNGQTGHWFHLKRSNGQDILKTRNNRDSKAEVATLSWDSVAYPGERIEGEYEALDGISQRYFSLRLLFGGHKPADFSWADRLAFMHCLELRTKEFYEMLSTQSKLETLRAISSQIAIDEKEHGDYLKYALTSFSELPASHIEKWQFRLYCSLWGLLVDGWRYL
ncbi:hypothetical protein WA1_18825 [Scytonema hofmannii PCC 7110]|uniref:Rubrerythrin family protein n=1 Tax=Scytonema hofmannii PCC 7110 TaxID=128403 RepID=A0A139XBH6_9CYAN|nr:hypothetical protein [Scytonema hofmannii]KYC42057.1 hypothetical protein WA1_18825 [Scytonema hofmannii PCC 7110]